MPQNFLACDREQELLLPPSLREWLPENHLAWCVIDAVAELDLAAFYAAYRADGWGRAAHEPAMMVALLLYAYAIGERSSRRIERHCEHDVAFRVIAANRVPDHATIARFRVRHERAIAFFDDNETWLARVLEDGRADGRLQFDAPPPEAARLIVSALEGAMLVARAYGDVERFHAAATGLLATLTRPASAAP